MTIIKHVGYTLRVDVDGYITMSNAVTNKAVACEDFDVLWVCLTTACTGFRG